MRIKDPLCITSRLLPGIQLSGAEISIEYAHITSDGRQAYRWFIDVRANVRRDFQDDRLVSGQGGGTLQKGLENLLVFLGAFAEANADTSENWEPSDNANLFPLELAEWAVANSDEIAAMACVLEEHPGEFIIEG